VVRQNKLDKTHKPCRAIYTALESKCPICIELHNKSKKRKLETARNIVNLITTRMESDIVFKKHFGNNITNKKCKAYCKSL